MISTIRFGSTYKINSQENGFDKVWNFQKFTNRNGLENTQIKFKEGSPKAVSYTVIVPDHLDHKIESYCASNGIRYNKLPTQSILNPSAVVQRIEPAPRNKRKALLNVEKFEQLLDNQMSNFKHCEYDYNQYYKNILNSMLKYGDKMPATTLSIENQSGTAADLIEYIHKHGANNLNEGQISINFNQKTDDPDHCTYFALRDIGLENIPIYTDTDTYKICAALGILTTNGIGNI